MQSSASAHRLHIHTSERSTQAQTRWAAGSVETLGQGKSAAWEEHKVYMDEWMATARRDGEVKKKEEKKERGKRRARGMSLLWLAKTAAVWKLQRAAIVCVCVFMNGGGDTGQKWRGVRERGQRQTWRRGDFSLVRCWQLDGWCGSAAFSGAALL